MKDICAKSGEALLIFDKTDRFYYSGIDILEGILLKSKQSVYFVDARYYSAVEKKLKQKNIKPYLYKSFSDVEKVVKELGVNTVYVDFEKVSVSKFYDIEKFGVKVLDCSQTIKEDKAQKSQAEIKLIKKACEITEKAYKWVLKNLHVGVSELEIKKTLEEKMLSLGAEGTSFDTIVAFGKNSAVPHHQTGKTTLKENSVVLIDTGAKYRGYCADITRTVFFGKPDSEFIKNYNAVLTANQKAIKEIKNGTDCVIADKIAREYLKGLNLDKYFTHSLGHGLGTEIHEYPFLSPKSQGVKLVNGMTFTIEPGVYFDNKYGIRIEDTVILDGEVKRLFTDDKKLKIIKI